MKIVDSDTDVKELTREVRLSDLKAGDVLDLGFRPYGHATVYAVRLNHGSLQVQCSRPYATYDSGFLRVGQEDFTLVNESRLYTKLL